MILVTGDCHGDFSRFLDSKFTNLTKDDYVIICGDFGGIWNYDGMTQYERNNIRLLSNMKFTTLFVDGNHENFDRLYKFPVANWHGGKVHVIGSSVFHLMRGEIYEIDGKTIFTFGGASSHDIDDGILNMDEEEKIYNYNKRQASFRIRNYDWWDMELPTKEEMQNGLNNLARYNYKVDYIISHCAPSSVQKGLNRHFTSDKLTDYFENIKNNVDFKKWYFGHYHIKESTLFENFECLYENVEQINLNHVRK